MVTLSLAAGTRHAVSNVGLPAPLDGWISVCQHLEDGRSIAIEVLNHPGDHLLAIVPLGHEGQWRSVSASPSIRMLSLSRFTASWPPFCGISDQVGDVMLHRLQESF